MAGTLTVDGLISGLDTQSIIDQLVSIQTGRIEQLQGQQAEQTNRVSLFQQLQGLFLSLRTAANTLTNTSSFDGRSATSSDSTVLTATASNDAKIGSHQLSVVQLATNNQFVSNRFENTDVLTFGTGDLSITVGTGSSAVTTKLSVNSSNNTLDGIANLINGANIGVTASIVKVDESTTPFQLIVTADKGGEANAVSIAQDSTIKNVATGEILGVGVDTANQDTDDNDGSTYALRHLPNAGTVTLKLGGTALTTSVTTTTPSLSTVTGFSATALDTGGDLIADRQYFYLVSAVDASGESLATSIFNATAPSGANDNSIRVDFNEVVGATSYRIYRLDATQDIGGPTGIDITDFQDQNSFLTTVVDDGSPTFSFTDTTQAALTGTNTPITAILNESTGAVTFNEAQTAQVTADYDFDLEFRESQTAKDAIIRFGSGSNAVTIKKSSNMVTDVIEGVTLDLLKVETTNPVIVTVAQNTLLAKSAVENFATALGEVQSFLKDQTFFDSETNETGPLFGDPNVLTIETQVNNILARPVSSIEIGKIRTIAEVGFSISADTGSFQLNSGDLATALSEKPDEVRDFFASVGKATDTDIEVLSFTEATKTSTALGYDVRITQAASRAEIVGAQDVSGGLTTNETLTITVDNNTASIGLTSGLSAQTVVSTINSGLEGVGIKNVRATLDSATGKITLRHDDFGSDKSFKVKSSKAGSTVGSTGLGGSSDNEQRTFTGTDVNGTINGESATGAGQVLTGSTGNLNAAGLKLRVTLTPASLASQGAFQGRVVVSRGIGSQLEEFLAFLTDENKDGPIQSAIDAADDRIEDLQDTIDTVTERSERERARLQREFTQLEQALGTLQTTSQFLDQQLQVIAQNTRFVASRGR